MILHRSSPPSSSQLLLLLGEVHELRNLSTLLYLHTPRSLQHLKLIITMSHSELFGLKGQKQSGLANEHGQEHFERAPAQEQELVGPEMRTGGGAPTSTGASDPITRAERSPSKPSNAGILSSLAPSLKPPKAQGENTKKSGNFLENLSLPGDGNAYDGVVGMGRRH